jgi:protoporphyrinogen oxidase
MLVEPGAPNGRAPEGCGLITLAANVSGAHVAHGAKESSASLEARLLAELTRILPRATRSYRFAKLHRDPQGAPRFDVGAYRALANFQRVQEDRRSLGRRLYWAGDYLSGPRFEDAVASGARAAGAVLADLAGR